MLFVMQIPPAVYETLLNNQRTNLMFDWKKKNGIFNGFICLLFWNKKNL